MLVPLVPTVPVFQPSKIKQPSDMDTTLHAVLPAEILQSIRLIYVNTHVHVAFHLCHAREYCVILRNVEKYLHS